ncbi:MAG: HAMP domain-containing protein [uncultured Sulfurovum sp.]|uniref:histidine kinase n=1 Tax=uncultured Sulfurovum sp. TaxID=269237 RepID=A0A6S6UI09_9BACT|nr:MAG: HAMP domain-containing protein [uncultured Sulfurovum sp.]
MINNLWRNRADAYKTVVFMLFFILLIQLGTLLYIWKFESKVLFNQEYADLKYELDQEAQNLENSLNTLEKELKFLSTLEIMDDVLAKDVDKRINVLLEKRANDLGRGIVLVAMKSGEMIASSRQNYYKKDFLMMEVPIIASFKKKQKIGVLQLLYPFKNLENLSIVNPHKKLWLSSFVHKKEILPKHLDNIIVSRKLGSMLKGDELFLSYEKKYAFKSLKETERILLFSFIVSVLLLIFVVGILSKKQVEVLEHTQEVLALKRTFLSTMSHELRTPLGSILNLTQHLMVSPKITDSDVEMLIRIEHASEHLLGMINNLLQLSKLESNSMLVRKEKLNIVTIINEMIEIVEPLIDEKNLGLNKEFKVENLVILTDINLFKQVVMNLLSNAIKFTEQGNISIRLTEENKFYILSIIDTGIGIEKEKQASLFSEFYQAHREERHNIKHSTGLGLALSSKVSNLIKGKIEIRSEGEGKGVNAIFTFTSL